MVTKFIRVVLFLSGIFPQIAVAISFTAFDPRSMAMGGAGVASAKPYNALLFNPAMLVINMPRNGEAFIRPYLGARLIDRDHFIEAVDTYQSNEANANLDATIEYVDALGANGFENLEAVLVLLEGVSEVAGSARVAFDDIENLSNKPLRVAVAGGLSFGFSGSQFAFGGSIRRNNIGGSIINLAEADITYVRSVISATDEFSSDLSKLIVGGATPLEVLALYDKWSEKDFTSQPDLTSTIEFQGAIVDEIAFSYATKLKHHPDWSLGFTLKQIDFTTIDYSELISEAEIADFNEPRFQKSYDDINLDIGVALNFTPNMRVGFVARNLVSRDYKTIRNRTIHLDPLMRIGFAWETEQYTLTTDLDLTSNDPLGFDPEKRYLASGVEWRIMHNFALRGGYRYNTVSGSQLWSAGLGIGPRNVHGDLAIAAEGDELGLALQFGAYF